MKIQELDSKRFYLFLDSVLDREKLLKKPIYPKIMDSIHDISLPIEDLNRLAAPTSYQQ